MHVQVDGESNLLRGLNLAMVGRNIRDSGTLKLSMERRSGKQNSNERHNACPDPSRGVCLLWHGISISCVSRCECVRSPMESERRDNRAPGIDGLNGIYSLSRTREETINRDSKVQRVVA